MIKLAPSDDSVEMMDAPGIVDTRYAVIVSKKLPPEYLKIAIENVYPEFYSRFNQCINMPFRDLLRLSVKIHNDPEVQSEVQTAFCQIEAILKAEQIEIENLKSCKKFLFDKMMAGEDLDDGDESGKR